MKKSKRIGDRESYLEHQAALLPLRFTFVPFGTGHAGSDVIGSPERPVLMEYVDDEATQKRFYEALLKLPWLAPKVRNAIMRELGGSQREEDVRIEKARTWTLPPSSRPRRSHTRGRRPPPFPRNSPVSWHTVNLRSVPSSAIIRTSEHFHVFSPPPRLSVRMFGSGGKKRANASSNCAAR